MSDYQDEILISLLQSCEQTPQTSQIHGLMVKSSLDSIPFPRSKLLAQLCTQDIHYAAAVFRQTDRPNLYMFNTMLRGYSVSQDPQKGLVLFNRMRALSSNNGFLLDQFTFVSVLKSCSRLLDIWTGMAVHGIVLASGFGLFLNVKNALLHLYCVCGRIKGAHQVFDELAEWRDLVSWNTLMGGYLCVDQPEFVLHLFKHLCRECAGVSVSSILNVLSALEKTGNVSLGQCLHVLCIKVGFLSDLNAVAALVSMYGKLGCIRSARQVFDGVGFEKDIVLWNCLIDGYAKSGLLGEAMELLRLMEHNGLQPNSATLAGLLSACSASGALAAGQYTHCYIEEQQLELDVVLGTALVDMYAKSGLLEKAVDVFNRMKCKDVRCWTAMISGFGVHGQASHAIALFHQMEEEKFVPNEVTFLAVLNACSHGGLVADGIRCFRRMVEVYRLVPKIKHYGCIIDLLARAGLLEEVYELIKGLPIERDATAWRALLGACRVYGSIDLAECAKQELEGIIGDHPADLLALSGTYTAVGMVLYDKCLMQKENNDSAVDFLYGQCAKKEAGYSAIEQL